MDRPSSKEKPGRKGSSKFKALNLKKNTKSQEPITKPQQVRSKLLLEFGLFGASLEL
jgi:hypothetical protein